MENQVTNLKLSRELQKIGVFKDSLYYWQSNKVSLAENCSFKVLTDYPIPAYTVSELGEMLPESVKKKDGWEKLLYGKRQTGGWFISFGKESVCGKGYEGETEANVRAEMLIYLMRNKLWSLWECQNCKVRLFPNQFGRTFICPKCGGYLHELERKLSNSSQG